MVQRKKLLAHVIWILGQTTVLWSQAATTLPGGTFVVRVVGVVPTLFTVHYVPIYLAILVTQHAVLNLHIV